MAGSSFGELFRFTTWGESHGPAIGVVVDGVPVARAAAPSRDPALARPPQPRPVQVHDPAPRAGPGRDPLGRVRGRDHRHAGLAADPQRGPALEGLWRDQGPVTGPGHADLTYDAKYGIRDYRGGGRSSARETASRVAAGASPARSSGPSIKITGYMVQMGRISIDRAQSTSPRSSAIRSGARTPQRRSGGRGSSARSASGARPSAAVVEVVATGRAGRPGRADLRQARRRPRQGDDVDQRGQGRGDRRRLRHRGPARRGKRRRDPHRQ